MNSLQQVRKNILYVFFFLITTTFSQVNTGGKATTAHHQKQIIGYLSNWDAWKTNNAGVPGQGALTHLNIDYTKYTILNYSFFGVANDGSLHSSDLRNKKIHEKGEVQLPADIFYTDIYSSWDLHILFGELDPVQYINQNAKERAEKQGFEVALNGTTWRHPIWGLSGTLPVPLHKEGGALGVLELAHQQGVKVMASIGGWSMSKHFPEMAADPVKKARFIADCKRLIAIGFDGIDLDWEYPGYSGMNFTGTKADFYNFELLVKDLRAAIGTEKLITTAMSSDPNKLASFNWDTLTNTIDYFNMMSYDFNGGWSDKAGHNAPVYPYTNAEVRHFNWESTLKKMLALGVPKNKICMGAPFYGRGVITANKAALNGNTVKRLEMVQPDGLVATSADFTNWKKDIYDGTPMYHYIKQTALKEDSGWERKWDSEAKVPYLVKNNFFLSYDDEESIAIKAAFIKDHDLGGAIIWTVFGDLEFQGAYTSYGTKLKRWSEVKSPLVNTINEVFASKTDSSNDNIVPIVSIIAPLNDTMVEEGTSLNIRATASDIDGNIVKVAFYKEGVFLGEDMSFPYEYNIATLEVGKHTFTAKSFDNEGASTKSSEITILVEEKTQLPKIKITNPQHDTFLKLGETVELWAIAENFKEGIDEVFFEVNGIKITGKKEGQVYKGVYTPLEEAKYEVRAIAIDRNGVKSENQISFYTMPTTVSFCDNYEVWSSEKIYVKGDNVQKNGTHYSAKWWTKNENPETNSENGVWERIADCSGEIDNTAPVIDMSVLNDKTMIKEGDPLELFINATDIDGEISFVKLYKGTEELKIIDKAPYTHIIYDLAVGTYEFWATATDNQGAVTASNKVMVTITNVVSDECNGLPTYVQGSSYTEGEKVQNKGSQFSCSVPGWCSSEAAWAYAPGEGTYWEDAWIKIGGCTVNIEEDTVGTSSIKIESPINYSTYNKGENLIITTALVKKENILKVVFYNGATLLGETTTSPYSYTITNANLDSYDLTAVAINEENDRIVSERVLVNAVTSNEEHTSTAISEKILVGYWHNFNNGAAIPKLREVATDWDVICVAFAEPVVGSTSKMTFAPYEIYGGNKQEFIDDITFLQERGQKVLISIGGANAMVHLETEEDKEAFVSSMTDIIRTYGFDGLDIDLEGSSLSLDQGDMDFEKPVTPAIVNLIAATKEIRAFTGGANFILSMAPETAYVQGGYGSYKGIFGAYLPVINGLRDELTYIHVQHYNTGSMFGKDGKIYQPGTADFHVAMAEMLITGFPIAQTGLFFPGLREEQVLIGLPSTVQAAGSGYTSEFIVQQAMDYLVKGTEYANSTYKTSKIYPKFRGIMTWSINWDLTNNSSFSKSHRSYLNGVLNERALLKESLKNDFTKWDKVTRVFPNPTNALLHLEGCEKGGKVEIFDAKGILIYEETTTTTKKMISVNTFKEGMYFYKVKGKMGIQTGSFIKEVAD
ncbi:glycosyl hydrolase family 18 protein [Tenacibaculum maritimum]|uniref:glycosyl hydrolase family 18 protein n=1 Tax=Tenacibaculum maritimum TaxID=107401 RepID=UPI0038768DC3